jgi:pyruvate kinase
VAHTLRIKAIVAFTRSGSTARLISKYRPPRTVYAFCHDERVACRASLYWGVVPLVMPLEHDADATLAAATEELLRRRAAAKGDILAIVAGSPGRPGGTNQMKLVRAGSG